MFHKLNKLIKDPYYVVGKKMLKHCPKLMPDRYYLSVMYYMMYWEKPDFDHPHSLNEKLQWLKLNDHNPLYTILADKYAVKEYIKEHIGEEYVIPTLGIYDSVDEIDISQLPEKFVLKCTHDSGSSIFCTDKERFDFDKAKQKLSKSLSENFYWVLREWPYKHIKHRIICEPYLSNEDGSAIVDYKFYCYGGHLQYFMYSLGEATHDVKNVKFNCKKESIDYYFKKEPALDVSKIILPDRIDEMIQIAEEQGRNFPHVRIDMYCVNEKIYIGEFTFYSNGGFINIYDKNFSQSMADLIDISRIK